MPLTSLPPFGSIPAPIDWSGWDGSSNTAFTSLSLGTGPFPISLVPMDTDSFALGFYNSDNFPKATVVTRSGDVISNGTLRTIDTSLALAFDRYQLQRLDTNKVAAFYAGNSGDLDFQNARVLSGATLGTIGSEIDLGTADRDQNLQMVPLDTDKIYYLRSRSIATQNVFSQIRTNTGPTTFASGNFLTVASGTRAFYNHAVKLPDVAKVVVAFTLQSSQNFQLRVIENTTGNTTVQGTALTITDVPGTTDEIVHLVPIDSTHVALLYSGSGSGGKTYIRIYSISGTTLTEELGQTELLAVQLNNNYGATSVISSADFAQLTSNQFMIVSAVAGSTTTNAYIISFPTPTTVSVASTVELSSTQAYTNICIEKVNDTIVLMLGKNTNTNLVEGRLLKL